MDIVVLGIDLGKNSCSLAGLGASGRVVLRRRMRRSSVEGFVNGLGAASWRWKHAAARIIWAACLPARGMKCA